MVYQIIPTAEGRRRARIRDKELHRAYDAARRDYYELDANWDDWLPRSCYALVRRLRRIRMYSVWHEWRRALGHE